MAEGKYARINDVIYPIVSEWCRVNDAINQITVNAPRIADVIEQINAGGKTIFIGEQVSDRLYAIDDEQAILAGWPRSGSGIVDPAAVAAAGSQGVSYWACANNVYKVNADGTIAWTFTNHTSPVKSICVETIAGIDYLYTGDYGGTIKRIIDGGTAGGQMWTYTFGANHAVYAIAIDHSTGQLYAGTGFAADAVWSCTASVGNWLRRYTCPYGDVTGLAIDEGTPVSLYIGTINGYLLKISTAGYVYWGSGGAVASDIHGVRVGHDGIGYCATGASKGLMKFVLATGVQAWHVILGGTAQATDCAVDQFGNVYGTFRVAGTSLNNVIRKVNSAGVEQWNWQPYLTAQFYCLAVTPGIKAAGY